MSANKFLSVNEIHCGNSCQLMHEIQPESIAISIWSPPYHVGKEYEAGQTYDEWLQMLREVIKGHYKALKPGGFLAINIGDILCFADPSMPRIQAENVSNRKSAITREDVLQAKINFPDFNRYQLAALLGCSEQTIDRRLNGNNIRGGKYGTQTRVKIVGGIIEEMGLDAGLYLYDHRIWVKDAAWANCNWTQNSYRSVDEFEDIYILWKPGITKVDRSRLEKKEWSEWGSRAVWNFASVRRNDIHEAMFPIELPRRLIKLFTEEDDIVLDPFVGSGTTALAAVELGRRYIGIDKEAKYAELSRMNIKNATQQIRLNI